MPGLDAHMDKIATEILSRWLPTRSTETLSWDKIDKLSWTKTGEIIRKNQLYSLSILLQTIINSHSIINDSYVILYILIV